MEGTNKVCSKQNYHIHCDSDGEKNISQPFAPAPYELQIKTRSCSRFRAKSTTNSFSVASIALSYMFNAQTNCPCLHNRFIIASCNTSSKGVLGRRFIFLLSSLTRAVKAFVRCLSFILWRWRSLFIRSRANSSGRLILPLIIIGW